jgi:hypothetical protein
MPPLNLQVSILRDSCLVPETPWGGKVFDDGAFNVSIPECGVKKSML